MTSDHDTDDKRRGLYDKYLVQRVDGKGRGPYFVLDYGRGHDPYVAAALRAYADACASEYPHLATDLRAAARNAEAASWADSWAEYSPEGEQ